MFCKQCGKKPIFWVILGMGIMLVICVAVGGGIFLFRNSSDQASETYNTDAGKTDGKKKGVSSKKEVDDTSMLIGTADRMTRNGSILANPFFLNINGTPMELISSIEPYVSISRDELVPVRAYYYDDMSNLLSDFANAAGLDGIEDLEKIMGGEADSLMVQSLPTLIAGRMVSVSYLAAISTNAYSRNLHMETKTSDIGYVILQYSPDGTDENSEEYLYTWTVFVPDGKGMVTSTTYYMTPVFNTEWGQQLIKDWKTFDKDKIMSARKAMEGYDYAAPSEGKRMDGKDYKKTAEAVADLFKDYDFMSIAELMVSDSEISAMIQIWQDDFHKTQPEYAVYSGETFQKRTAEQLEKFEKEVREEIKQLDDAERKDYFGQEEEKALSVLLEQARYKWDIQMFSTVISQYGTTALAANSVIQSAASLACRKMGLLFVKPDNWNGPKVVVAKYENVSVAFYFYECGNNYVSVGIYFLSDKNGFEDYLESAGFELLSQAND